MNSRIWTIQYRKTGVLGALCYIGIFACLTMTLLFPLVGNASGGAALGSSSHQHEATPLYEKSDFDSRLLDQWALALPRLQQRLVAELKHGNTNALYTTQLNTANLLIWADKNADRQVLEDLGELYQSAFRFARMRQKMKYYYAEPGERITTVELAEAQPAWLPVDSSGVTLPESLLDSAQFLYAIVRLSRAHMSHGIKSRFAASARALALSHLRRWIVKSATHPGSFQTRGWGCSGGTYSHAEHIENLRVKAYGTRKLPRGNWSRPESYCNAIVDTDLFITAIIGEVLIMDSTGKREDAISDDFRATLQSHLKSSLKLIRSRMSDTQIRQPNHEDRRGLLLDTGVWDEYRDYKWSNYTGAEFPGWLDEKTRHTNMDRRSARAQGVGWDVSHARRFVQFLDTLEAMTMAGVKAQFDTEDREAIARQIIIATWNGSIWRPRFANYIDGTNGWYRVNYANRAGYGIKPFGFDNDIIACGYGFFSHYDPLIKRILQARLKIDRIDHHQPEYQIQWLASASLLLSEQ